MHDSTPFYVPKLTCELFEHKRFRGEKIMEWSPSNPDLNPTENLLSIEK